MRLYWNPMRLRGRPLLCLLLAFTCSCLSLSALAIETGLVPVDETPLDGRHPLILVHGINPEAAQDYSWQAFLETARRHPGFETRYKPYLFVFDPAQRVVENARVLQEDLRTFPEAPADPAKPFRYVALSLGGLIVKDALNDSALWARTDRIIALGVPFHGATLAEAEWVRAALKDMSALNILRYTNRMGYWVTRRKFPHFRRDYCWDNFDGGMPEAIARRSTCMTPASVHRPEEEQTKYITYAAFFGAGRAEREWLAETLGMDPALINQGGTRKNPFSRHFLFRLVRPALARLPLNQPVAEDAVSPMAFNDGISPIASQLWLGRTIRRDRRTDSVELDALWQAVRGLSATENARLFEGLDHRDWLDEKTRYRNQDARLVDWLHPNQPQKTVFDWIIFDLMR